jgi:hypothetical protein
MNTWNLRRPAVRHDPAARATSGAEEIARLLTLPEIVPSRDRDRHRNNRDP